MIIPIHQHLGVPSQLCVSVGEHVLKRSTINKGVGRTLPVHASISGTVTAIEPFQVPILLDYLKLR